MNWQPHIDTPPSDTLPSDTAPAEDPTPDPAPEPLLTDPIAAEPVAAEPTPVAATASAPAPVAETPTESPVGQLEYLTHQEVIETPAPVLEEPEPAVELAPEAAIPEAPPKPVAGTIHVYTSTSNRPIDRFIAMSMNDISRLVGTRINSGRRGQEVTITALLETGVLRETAKGTSSEIPRQALEWAIKQLYLNGELTRSKMTESYKENGSSIASGVFQVLTNVRFFEATETPLTLHFYKLQWEDELYG